jgi:hypothetical protein
MAGNNEHKIKHQVIEMETSGDDAFVLQQKLSRLNNEKLITGMELLFDRLAPPGKWYQMDKLQVEVENIDKLKFESEFADKTLQAIEKALRSRLRYQDDLPAVEANQLDGPARLALALIHFLEKGYFPWWFSATVHVDFEMQLAKIFSHSANPSLSGDKNLTAYYIQLLEKTFEKATAVRRFVSQFSDNVAENLILLLYSAEYDLVKQELEVIKSFIRQAVALSGKSFVSEWRKTKEMLIQYLPGKQPFHDIEKELVRKLFLQQGEKIFNIAVPPSLLQQVMREAVKDKKLMQTFLAEGQQIPEIEVNDNESREEISHTGMKKENEIIRKEKTVTAGSMEPIKEKHQVDTEIKISKPESKAIEKEGIYIANAGLVIMAPFLPVFFRKIELAVEKELTGKAKAVCLLQYLAGYDTNWKEYDMPLNKILCGAEPGDRIDTDIKISADEKGEANKLLESVIENWAKLGHTSVRGLQEGFLQRNGKLTPNGNEWLLQVEQKPYDMLLEHLPWSISIIKLPWMKYVLKTEWFN